jgi:hypothetical protein
MKFHSNEMVQEAGFAIKKVKCLAARVDGFINHDGIAEYKCPIPAIHYGYMQDNKVPK